MNPVVRYVRAWRLLFARGLTHQQQMDRNMDVIAGNVTIIAVLFTMIAIQAVCQYR